MSNSPDPSADQTTPEQPTEDRGSELGVAPSSVKLFRVRIERVIAVMAENQEEAEREALWNEREDASEPEYIHARPVEKITDLPQPWWQSIPFGGDLKDERTCAERLSPNAASETRRPSAPHSP